MARKRDDISVETDLNLAPIMNMVVILIPLLLLSVVFLKVGVINITAPKLSMGPPSDAPPPVDEPLNLTVAVSSKGFRLAATGAVLPEMAGCPVPGPTICLEDQSVDVAAKLDKARSAFASDQNVQGQEELRSAMAAARRYVSRAVGAAGSPTGCPSWPPTPPTPPSTRHSPRWPPPCAR